MKLKRSSRLVDMTGYLLQHSHQIISLTYFSERYESAKSSISEDLGIIKENFETQGYGRLETIAGASGGVKYLPMMDGNEASLFLKDLGEHLSETNRLLPGGYLYMTDILGQPGYINAIGRMIASHYVNASIDVVMTMETKGIPLAYAVASYFNVPVVIVRRSSKVTEGSTVSINYISGSFKRIQTMVLPKRSMKAGSRVLVIDDFMKAGGTLKGMKALIEEFEAEVAGTAVFVETKDARSKLVDDYVSLLKLKMNDDDATFSIEEGSIFNNK